MGGIEGRGVVFDRRVSDALVHELTEGCLQPLLERRRAEPTVYDVQLRANATGRNCWVTLYAGLSSVLSVEERDGRFRLSAHETYARVSGFDYGWWAWRSPASVAADWFAVDHYLDRVRHSDALQPHLHGEGKVHAAMSTTSARDYWTFQREASPAFANTAARAAVVDPLVKGIHDAMRTAGVTKRWWPGVRDGGKLPRMGTSPDLLAIDPDGRLLVIEAKPSGREATKAITWAPAQVRLYAELFHRLLTVSRGAVEVLQAMADQHHRVTQPGRPAPKLADEAAVVPVVAIGAGLVSPTAMPRLERVQEALTAGAPAPHLAPLEVWRLADDGAIKKRTVR